MALTVLLFVAAPIIGLVLRAIDWRAARRQGRPFRFWWWRGPRT